MAWIRLLHVEDDSDDAFFFTRALKAAAFDGEVVRLSNAEAAMNFLEGCEPAKAPDLMVLDLRLPGMSGFEFLAWLRAQERYMKLPVVVLSGSSLAEDRNRASALGASTYLVKSSTYRDAVPEVLRIVSERQD